jgi:hypothetical protein
MHPYPPDPYQDDGGPSTVFDADVKRFADVALVEFSPDGVALRRGALPGRVSLADLEEAGRAIDALPGEVFGVLTNALGDLVLAEDGVDFGYDVRFEREIVIDASVPHTDCPDDLRNALNEMLTSVIQARAELARTLSAGWRVFHVQSCVEMRISCYDPAYRAQ